MAKGGPGAQNEQEAGVGSLGNVLVMEPRESSMIPNVIHQSSGKPSEKPSEKLWLAIIIDGFKEKL